jgi:hypothetical protein
MRYVEESMSEDNDKLDQKSEEKMMTGKPAEQERNDQSSLPLYLRDKPEGNRDSAQDEKDESAE